MGAGFYTVDNIVIPRAGLWELKLDIRKSGIRDVVYVKLPEIPGASEEVTAEEALPAPDSKEEMSEVAAAATGDDAEGAVTAEPAVAVPLPAVMAPEADTSDQVAAGDLPEGSPAPEQSETPEAVMPLSVPDTAYEDPYMKYRTVLQPLPALAPVPADNSLTSGKIRMGKMLFWERRLSGSLGVSCSDCHHPSYYGAEPSQGSVVNKAAPYRRNTGTVLNAAFATSLFWTGDHASLEDLVRGGSDGDTSVHAVSASGSARLAALPLYRGLFNTSGDQPLDNDTLSKALAAYLRTLVTPDYPLARWLQGDEDALTEQQKQGMGLFIEKGCSGCHSGPAFSGTLRRAGTADIDSDNSGTAVTPPHFYRVEVPGAEQDLGLAGRTGREEDKYLFRVPSLLNVALTAPYTHAGQIEDLHEMVRFMAASMLSIELDSDEVNALASFLHALTGAMPPDFLSVPVLSAVASEKG
jgi:cytochrome c peroxidase